MKTNTMVSCWLLKFSSAYKHCPAEFMFISQVFWYIIMVSLYWLDFRKVYARWNMPPANIWKYSIRVPKTNRQKNRMIICWIITRYKLPITTLNSLISVAACCPQITVENYNYRMYCILVWHDKWISKLLSDDIPNCKWIGLPVF